MGPSTEPWLQVQERGPLVLRKSTPEKEDEAREA